MNESSPFLKTSHIPVCTSHAKCADHLNIGGSPFPVKCVRKFRSALGGEAARAGACVFVCVCVCVSVCVCVYTYTYTMC